MTHGTIDIDMDWCNSTVYSTIGQRLFLQTTGVLTAPGGYGPLSFSNKSEEKISEKPLSDVHYNEF